MEDDEVEVTKVVVVTVGVPVTQLVVVSLPLLLLMLAVVVVVLIVEEVVNVVTSCDKVVGELLLGASLALLFLLPLLLELTALVPFLALAGVVAFLFASKPPLPLAC